MWVHFFNIQKSVVLSKLVYQEHTGIISSFYILDWSYFYLDVLAHTLSFKDEIMLWIYYKAMDKEFGQGKLIWQDDNKMTAITLVFLQFTEKQKAVENKKQESETHGNIQ